MVAVACAIMPYVVVRGPVTRLTRGLYKKSPASAAQAPIPAEQMRVAVRTENVTILRDTQ